MQDFYLHKKQKQKLHTKMFSLADNIQHNILFAPLALNVKVCTPEKRNPKAAIFHKPPLNYNNLAKQLQTYSWLDLISWSILTHVACDNGIHQDYKKHLEWLKDNLND